MNRLSYSSCDKLANGINDKIKMLNELDLPVTTVYTGINFKVTGIKFNARLSVFEFTTSKLAIGSFNDCVVANLTYNTLVKELVKSINADIKILDLNGYLIIDEELSEDIVNGFMDIVELTKISKLDFDGTKVEMFQGVSDMKEFKSKLELEE